MCSRTLDALGHRRLDAGCSSTVRFSVQKRGLSRGGVAWLRFHSTGRAGGARCVYKKRSSGKHANTNNARGRRGPCDEGQKPTILLRRAISRRQEGIEHEAGQRHANISLKELGRVDSQGHSNPGVK